MTSRHDHVRRRSEERRRVEAKAVKAAASTAPVTTDPAACIHRGPATGETVVCGTCPAAANKTAEVYACSQRGKCAPSLRRHHEVTGCLGCSDRTPPASPTVVVAPAAPPPPGPFTGPVVRNLLYHLWPVRGNGVWQRNVEHLRRRAEVFNGRRVVAVVTDTQTDDVDAVRRAFDGLDVEFLFAPNRPRLREMATWLALWSRVLTDDPNAITFYAHAKGVRHEANPAVTVHDWTDVLWESNVDYLPLVEDQLTRFPITGCFKKHGRHFGADGSRSAWHYSGTFYWVRQKDVPGERLGLAERFWAGNEAWPGVAFSPEQGGSLFFDHPGSYDQYDRAFWDAIVAPAWERWKALHAPYRRPGA